MTPTKKALTDTWHDLIKEWRQTGLSQAKFCKVKGISYTQFKYYRYRIRDKEDASKKVLESPCDAGTPNFEPVKLMPVTRPPASASLDVGSSPITASQPFKLTLTTGLSLEMPSSIPVSLLKAIVKELQSC